MVFIDARLVDMFLMVQTILKTIIPNEQKKTKEVEEERTYARGNS